MKDIAQQEDFIRLRAEGYSLAAIATKIGVCKVTLIKWHHEFEDQIRNLKYEHIESLIEEYRLSKQFRIQAFAKLLQKLLLELEERDFSKISDKHLIHMILSLDAKLAREMEGVSYFTGEFHDSLEIFPMPEQKTLPLFY